MNILLRPAWPADAAAVCALLVELGYTVPPERAASLIGELARTGTDAVLVAAEGSTLLGVIALHWAPMLHQPSPYARITTLVVAAAARRRGIGQMLVTHATEVARAAGCIGIELTTGLQRTEAHEFYRSMGFTATALRFRRGLEA